MIFVDLYLLIVMLLPQQHQIPETVYSMRAAMKPLNDIQTSFYNFFDQIKYDLQFNGQVCNLKHRLNDQFDNINRTIEIVDAIYIEQTYLFNKTEINEPEYVFNLSEGAAPYYIFNDDEISQFDFIIQIPTAVTYNVNVINFLMNKYKLAGKRYKIEVI